MKTYKSLQEEIRETASGTSSTGNIVEGSFTDIFTSVKLSKDLAAAALKMQKSIDPKSPETIKAGYKQLLDDSLALIKKSKMSPDIKKSYEDSFLGGMFGQLKQLAPNLSGEEIKKRLEIPDDIYRRMVSSYAQQRLEK